MDAAKAKLEAKLTQLRVTKGRTKDVVEANNCEKVLRHQQALKALVSEADCFRRDLEGLKIVNKEDLTETAAWNSQVEEEISKADQELTYIQSWLDEKKRESKKRHREEELEFERELFETRLKFEFELQKAKEQQPQPKVDVQQDTPTTATGLEAKLPKLVITKFNGTYQDWPRFWGQFKETIDKSNVASVTKFAYLRELLDDKVKSTIEALPFTIEGYNRAKSILQGKFGKESEIVKAYTKQILELPTIPDVNVKKIHEFSDKLSYCVQSLETMGKLQQVNGNVAMTLDKLPAIRGDLVRTDPTWQEWDYVKLTDALCLWTRRNPIDESTKKDPPFRHRDRKVFQTKNREVKPRGCVYCDDATHKSSDCPKIVILGDRKQILAQRRLCFNCTREGHRAANCTSKISCQNCDRRHHTSVCDQKEEKKIMTATKSGEGIFPVVTVKVNGITCRALIDSGAGSSYASAKLVNMLHQKPVDVKTKKVEMLMSSRVERLETYETEIEALEGNHNMRVNLIKVNKEELLSVDNPNYTTLIGNYPHLKGVQMNDNDTKPRLPIHVVLGGGEYARVKTESRPRVGREGEPIAELTKLGWFIMSPGQVFDHHRMLMTQTSQTDYEELCRLDVLGLEDAAEHDQGTVYSEFKEQLVRSEEGWYETELPWRGNHPPLPSNKPGSLRRLASLTKKLKREGLTEEYRQIIKDQNNQGIVELAPKEPTGQEFYLPHKPVIREDARSTKIRVVYDASARASPNVPSLNECLYSGPPLQNKLWDVLVRQRSFPVVLCGDIQKAFLQIRIKQQQRDALRFHWCSDEHSQADVYRFTRALFGLTSSPFLLGGVIEQHLETWKNAMPEIVTELQRCMYVDDLLSGGQTVGQALERKSKAIEIFKDASFVLHKWSSNITELEDDQEDSELDGQPTFAKQQLGNQPSESKILGLQWNKEKDTLSVLLPSKETPTTKRGVLSKLAQVYDPLGLASPLTLEGKLIYRDICNHKLPWDAELAKPLARRWICWKQSLPMKETVPRPIVDHQEPVLNLELHAFGDASTQGVGAAVYTVVHQMSGITQRLIAAKGRLAKQGLTVPRLELISAHMAMNLAVNVKNALDCLPTPSIYAWLDSTVALHWIRGDGQYKQFVANRVSKIHQHPEIQWRHVPTLENPADLASRGGQLTQLWWNGPNWLADQRKWPLNPMTCSSTASEDEVKVTRQVVAATKITSCTDDFDQLLQKHDLRRALRVMAWIARFMHNCQKGDKLSGPLTAAEIEGVKGKWIQRVQQRATLSPKYEQAQKELNLQVNSQGLIECRGRIEGIYPIYLPTDALFTRKLVQKLHYETLHGGVGLTMAAVREKYWVPKLRGIVKSVRKECWGCKRFQTTALAAPPPGNLPDDRTKGETAFEVVGVDFAGPIRYKKTLKCEEKAYLALFACSLIRAVHLELLPNLETETFIPCLKRFIARRGRPRKIYSDNGGTFVKAEKWLRTVRSDERLQGYLENHEIKWQFNLSRAPWWGGQFERLIGVVKQSMYKAIGRATLSWSELSEVILDVETQINRRPLSYVEDDVQLPVLTPSSYLFQRSTLLPEKEPWREGEKDLRKRAKYLKSCKDALWNRWSKEYLTALRERHNLNHNRKKFEVNEGDVVIVKSDEKNRGKWPLGIVQRTFPGRDGVTRAVKVKTGNGFLERPVQHLYPLELSCDKESILKEDELNPEAKPFRPRRAAAAAKAAENIKLIAEQLI